MCAFPFPTAVVPGQRLKRLVAAIRQTLATGVLLGSGLAPARAELPVPADVLVAPGAGNVLAPVVSGNNMTIKQLSDKATLNWKSFNIGADSSVHFDQPSATSVALNNIHQGDPSRIYGSLTANGQVYLVNQNGFVFGKDASINVNALVASTLNISERTFQLGLVQAFDQARAPALQATDAAGNLVKSLYLKDAAGNPVLDERGGKVKIQIFVDKGASLKTNAAGGRIILAAPSITNQGDIEAKDGQVILAASQDKVYLQQANAESGVRGMLVEVGTGGDVNNVGKILAERGNASLIGFAVNQQGLVSASTSVRLNGSVRLLAREGIQDPIATSGALRPGATKRAQDAGDTLGTNASVTLAKGSVTSVELDANKSETAVDAQAQSKSRIEIAGQRIIADSGSAIRAKSGQVRLQALDNPAAPNAKGDARIYLDAGSRIDVSGVKNVSLPMSRNTVKLELRSNELRDAPLQREGVLHGKTVTVDLREIGTDGRIPIADMSGALDRIARNIDERSTVGGSIDLNSSGDVVTRSGSVQDFSGGSVAYQGGNLETTQLVSGNLIFDLAHADPDRHYDGILGEVVKFHRKWGIRELWPTAGPGLSRFEAGYVEGKAGGSLNLSAYNAMLDGLMKGETIIGENQRQPEQQATGSALTIDLNKNNQLGRQDVVFAKHAITELKAVDPFPQQEGGPAPLALSVDPDVLRGSGVSQVQIKTNGTVRVPDGERISLPRRGKLELQSSGARVEGTIDVPAGDVTIKPITSAVDGQTVSLPSSITVAASGRILARGEWVNDTPSANATGSRFTPVAIDGGHVSLTTEQGDLLLEPGSRIDVGGGAWMQADSKVTAGKGGSIGLTAKTSLVGKPASAVQLGGELSGWALSNGGALTLNTSQVAIGSSDDPAALVLGSDFFQNGGFADFHLESNQKSLIVGAGEAVRVQQRNLILRNDAALKPSGESLREVSTVTTIADDLRNPANLTLSLTQATAQDRKQELRVADGASIIADRGASITLNSDTSVLVEGAISAPAGSIGISVKPPGAGDSGFFASQGIWLGSNARLSARGVFQREANGTGLVTGSVHDGGTIALDAARGYIVALEGASVDASGTTADLQFATTSPHSGAAPVETRSVPSGGGTISLRAGEGIIADGSFRAVGGGSGAEGGRLLVELNAPRRAKPADQVPGGVFPDDRNPKAPRSIVVSAASGPFAPSGLALGGDLASADFSGRAYLSAESLNAGGFGSVQLKTDALRGREYVGQIQFRGDVTLEASREIVLDTPVISAAGGDGSAAGAGQVSLSAPHVALGSTQSRLDTRSSSGTFTSSLAPEAIAGNGRLQVTGQGVDLVGGLSLDGIGQAALESSGAIRGIGARVTADTKDYLGEFKTAGNLNLRAAQVYPTTLTDFSFELSGADSVLTVEANGESKGAVLSAGGSLKLNAAEIKQGGSLLAPFGQISLAATKHLELSADSLTSVSGQGATVPFGRGSGALNWLYPLDGIGVNNRVIEAPPEKRIALSAPAVDLKTSARVDLSGSGDLYAYEFITGPGGTRDVLDPTDSGFTQKYAVIPGITGISTPYDPAEYPASALHAGDSVQLSGGSGLAPGRYTLLPAHYALLPGAYLIRPVDGTLDMDPAQSYRQMDGATVVAGRFGVAETRIQSPRWQGFAVEPGAVARTRSQFQDYSANTFFAGKAEKAGTNVPRLPRDAGSLSISADTEMSLAGDLVASAGKGGLGGNLDISANRLAIVARREDLTGTAPGTVGLVAEDLNRLNVESLLLGGLRSEQANSERLTVVSNSVELGAGAGLSGREILLAAKDQVSLRSGSKVESTGDEKATARDLTVSNQAAGGAAASGDGALVRVSSLGQVNVTREGNVGGQTGVLLVESGATLKSDAALLLDSTQDTRFAGEIAMSGGSLALKARAIGIGEAPAGTPGLVLPNLDFELDELKLTSAGAVSFYGSTGITAKNLFIDANGIQGVAGGDSTLAADVIGLSNHSPASAPTATGTGSLAINSRLVRLGDGDFGIGGFNTVSITASEALLGDAKSSGRLNVSADLNVTAGHVSGGDGASSVLDASGHALSVSALTPPEKLADTIGLGVSWTLNADNISNGARFDLPSGALAMKAAQGDLSLADGAQVDLSGQVRSFGDQTRYSPGGTLLLESTAGTVELASGAVINLAGASGGSGAGSDAGLMDVRAPSGSFRIDASIFASAPEGFRQGRVAIDTASLGNESFASLNRKLAASGFSESLAVRQRSGDLVLPAGEVVRAHHVVLSADAGLLDLVGQIDASGSQAGTVEAHGGAGLTLADGASIDAHADSIGANGGRVLLNTVRTGLGTADSGLLDLSHSASIDVSPGIAGEPGEVHLRTGRNDGSGRLAATEINARIRGDADVALEAVRVYDNQSTVDAPAIAGWQSDTAAYMASAAAPANASGTNIVLAPGLDIRSAGDLSVSSSWDFMARNPANGDLLWRYQGVPGFLRLEAAGDINVSAPISDGFATAALPDPVHGTLRGVVFQDVLQQGPSWSFSLDAGRDVKVAAVYPAAAGDASQVFVRTGTGRIDINAGRDIRLDMDPTSKVAGAVYTMGKPADYTFGDLLTGKVPGIPAPGADQDLSQFLSGLDPAAMSSLLRWGYFNEFNVGFGFLAEYPTQGGNIGLTAGGNIVGAQTGQLSSDWLVRSGNWSNDAADSSRRPTAWGINISGSTADETVQGLDANGNPVATNVKGRRFFNQNVGALGGGEVTVSAGGNVENLSVMVPTSGKPFGNLTTPQNGGKPDLRAPDGAFDTRWIENGTQVAGGGDIRVEARGSILGGEFYVGKGTGTLQAGTSITADSTGLGPAVALGDAQVSLQARKDLVLGSAFNPTLLPQKQVPDRATQKNSYFFTYGPASGLELGSTGGDIILQNNVEALRTLKGYAPTDGNGFELSVYPGTLKAAALAGNVRIDNSLNLYPSASGQLELLAGNSIGTGLAQDGIIKLNMSDADPSLLANPQLPDAGLLGDLPRNIIRTRERLDAEIPSASVIHAVVPVHQGDPSPVRLIAQNGDVAFPTGVQMKLFLPKSADVKAGRDIKNLSVSVQNLKTDDITRLQAGRDILFDARLDANGGVVPADQRLQVGGSGRLQVLAGRDINLGSSSGVLTVGNLFNRALSGTGAAIDVLAGVSDEIDYTGFIKKYLALDSTYLKSLTVFDDEGNDISSTLSPAQKLAYVEALPDQAKLGVVEGVLFSEIKKSAAAAAAAPESKREALYQVGFDAIETLFPGDKYKGDLALVFSQIKSLVGGDINIAAPGGQVDVGLAGKVGGIQKAADQLGIVVQQQGNLNALSQGDFNVNQSRVFTMGGGDIVVWSSAGSIDAGKGAKSAISAPPVSTGIDEKGNIVTIFPPIISGSGIQAINPADKTQRQGNVYLAAPTGVVNAGEAGISGGQVVIAATAVIGASNIQASGGTVGVPTAVSVPVVPAGADSAAASAAKSATQNATQDSNEAKDEARAAKAGASILSADVVGYGQCSVTEVREGKPGCGG